MSMATYSLNLSRCAAIGVLVCLWAGLLFLIVTAMGSNSPSLPLPSESPFRFDYVYPFWCRLYFTLDWRPEVLLGMTVLTFVPPTIVAIRVKAWRKLGSIILCLLVMLLYSIVTDFDWRYPDHRDWMGFLYFLSAIGLTPITWPLLTSLCDASLDKILCRAAYLGLIFYCPLLVILAGLGSVANICVNGAA
jgi:hypothetical protein